MVSVIMLTYNRETYVENMITDILGQLYSKFEFIIVDNGSTDKSGKIADIYANRDDRVRVIHLDKPYSIGYARNRGLEAAIGQYIAFVDDDDRVEPDYLQVLVNLILENRADIAICGIEEKQGKIIVPQCVYDKKFVLSGKEAVIELLKRKKIRTGLPTKLINKSIFQKVQFDENCRAEDARTTYKIFAEANRVVMWGNPLYLAVKHNNNNSAFTNDFSKLTYEILNEYLETYLMRTQYLIRRFPDYSNFWNYTTWSFMISMCEKINKYKLQDCSLLYQQMSKELELQQTEIYKCEYLKTSEKIVLNNILKDGEAK